MPLPAFLAPAELEARLRLHALPGIGPRRHQRLLACFASASAALSAPASAWRALDLPVAAIEARRSAEVRAAAAAALAWLQIDDHHLLLPEHPGWPALPHTCQYNVDHGRRGCADHRG